MLYATRSDVAATAGRLPSGFCTPHPRSSTVQGVLNRCIKDEFTHNRIQNFFYFSNKLIQRKLKIVLNKNFFNFVFQIS